MLKLRSRKKNKIRVPLTVPPVGATYNQSKPIRITRFDLWDPLGSILVIGKGDEKISMKLKFCKILAP